MARTRLAVQKQAAKNKTASSPTDWHKLAMKVIEQARANGDLRRVRMLEQAIKDNRVAQTLKRMNIVSEVDLDRELSPQKT